MLFQEDPVLGSDKVGGSRTDTGVPTHEVAVAWLVKPSSRRASRACLEYIVSYKFDVSRFEVFVARGSSWRVSERSGDETMGMLSPSWDRSFLKCHYALTNVSRRKQPTGDSSYDGFHRINGERWKYS